jgi:hypothetical protein
MSDYLIAFLGSAVLGLIGWLAYLQFGRFIIKTTHDAANLRHGAEFARGYKAAWLMGLTKIANTAKRSRQNPG